MIRLVPVELRRILSRRVTWLALVASVLIAGTALFAVHEQARYVNQSRAQAEELLAEAQGYWEQFGEQDYQNCVREQENARRQSGDARIDFGCEDMAEAPQLEDFIAQMPSLHTQYEELLRYLVYPFLFLALAIGSTSVAAEYSHRTLGSWLTFVPRRVPVFLSKLSAAALVAVPIVALGLVVVLLGVPTVFRVHGIDDNVSAAQWGSLAWMALRIIGLGMLAGAFGAAAAFLLRHSAAVIGLMVGYLVLAEGVVRGLLPSATPYLLGVNIDAVVRHGTEWTEWPVNCNDIDIVCREIVHTLSFAHGVTVLAVVLAVVLTAALLVFRRADVD